MWEVVHLLRASLGPQVCLLPKKRGPDNRHMKGTCPVGQTDQQVVGDGRKEAGEREHAGKAIQQSLRGARRKLAIDSVLKPRTNNSH